LDAFERPAPPNAPLNQRDMLLPKLIWTGAEADRVGV
jgi:hypothetical protein